VPYSFRIDGEVVDRGLVDLTPGKTKVGLRFRWTFDRHRISFAIDAQGGEGDGNELTVASDALSLGLWVERGLYDWMLEEDRPGFERFMQREIARWNDILARAVFPTTPEGALDRIRLDRVVVLPDGRRPKNEELDTDLHWVFLNDPSISRFLHKGAPPMVLADQTIILHELLHQRGLTDLYAYHVVHGDAGRTESRVDITENGRPVVGTFLMPPLSPRSSLLVVYNLDMDGVMGTRYRASANLTEHCANGLNLVAGRRTPLWLDRWGNLINGYSNAVNPGNYLHLLPERTELTLVDQNGAPIGGAAVDVYADHSADTYQKIYLEKPDRILAADTRGVALLPGDVLDGLPPKTAPHKSQVIIVGVRTSQGRGFAFIPVYDLNLLYFRSGPERGEMTLRVQMHPW
jgi:hypothetical protein